MTNANQKFQERAQNIESLIAQLQAALEAEKADQAKNQKSWAYVGDLAHVEENLQEMVDFLTQASGN